MFFSLLGSVGAIVLAGLLLLFPGEIRGVLTPCLISYAVGTLLGGAFLVLMPQAMEEVAPTPAMTTVLAGIVIFFVLEKLLIWRHCHDEHCDIHDVSGPLILIGDAFHNFTDGLVIAATFIASIPLGIAVSLAVIAHEVPQEVGDFGILLNAGYPRMQAFACNLLSGLGTFAGAVVSYLFLTQVSQLVPYIMAFSAASFIYIAVADLFPILHRSYGFCRNLRQLALILTGIGTIAVIKLHL